MKPLPAERRPGECVDCFVADPRPRVARPTDGAPRKPRCTTHKRAERKRAKAAAHASYVVKTYGLSRELQVALWELQGKACPCGRQPSRHPDTDHDHGLAREHAHPTEQACEECVRGLCCRACNTYVLGRYSPAQLRALADYIEDPPMARLRRELAAQVA